MIKPTIQRILATALQLWQQRRAFAMFAALYAILLATLYGFAVVREATLIQVLATLALILAAPLEFFILQAVIIDRARQGSVNWRASFRNALRLAVVTLPVIIIAAGLLLVLNQWQSHFPAPAAPPWLNAESLGSATNEPLRQNLHWPTLLFSTLRWLLFGVLLPLATIHLWIEAANPAERQIDNWAAPPILWRTRKALSRALAPETVFTYTIGLVLFAMIPYALLFLRLPLNGRRTDFVVFIVRLVLVFLTTLFGWVLTITALARNSFEFESDAFELESQIHDDEDGLVGLELQAASL